MSSADKMIKLRWPHNHPIDDKSIRSKMNRMRQFDGLLTDMAISSGDKYFPCHKLILVNASNYIQELLKIIATPVGKLPVIGVKEEHEEHIDTLLQFLYCGTLVVPTGNLHGLCKLAEKLQIHFLIEGVYEYENMSEEPEPQIVEEQAESPPLPAPARTPINKRKFAISNRLILSAKSQLKSLSNLKSNEKPKEIPSAKCPKICRRGRKKVISRKNIVPEVSVMEGDKKDVEIEEEQEVGLISKPNEDIPDIPEVAAVEVPIEVSKADAVIICGGRPRRNAYKAAGNKIKLITAQLLNSRRPSVCESSWN